MGKPFCLFIQPPFTQLSSPYPAIWYLAEYASQHDYAYAVYDDSITCIESIFSANGLRTIFELAEKNLRGKKHPNKETEKQVKHFLSNKDAYCNTIESVIKFLQNKNPSFGTRLCLHNGIPQGWRTKPLVQNSSLTRDDAYAIGTAMLNDLADFIQYAVDPHFNLIQYGSKIQSSIHDFSVIESQLETSTLLPLFYKPILEKHCNDLMSLNTDNDTIVAGISIPFPGTLVAGLYACKFLKNMFGNRVITMLGGGYVSTELRSIQHAGIFNYADYLAFDAGFGALQSVLDIASTQANVASACEPDGSRLIYLTKVSGTNTFVPSALNDNAVSAYNTLEHDAIRTIHPRFKELKPEHYLSIADSQNPMHRLWNETLWLKYRLAYGCYWHRCAFCDTNLDYVKNYIPSDTQKIFAAISEAAQNTGITGIHFTDEAMPPALVKRFAEFNEQNQCSYTFWGNIRFDHGWTQELCTFCAERGLIAVSGGIEIATENGLNMTQKGFSLDELIHTLYNLRSAGIMVHAYLMYGFPGQTHQSIADSAEMVRALFAYGLITSAFWHRFVLTKHSTLYAHYTAGTCPWLKPKQSYTKFADNDLDFEHSNYANPWDTILEASLTAWSEFGDTQKPLSAFAKKIPAYPRINGLEYVKKIIHAFQNKP
ncbi:MAG TPA: hypothetical protein PK025_00260 [Spirochaetales bacterium]|nr:hypothetical protein [Spirochaetales bacterium]